MKNKQKKYYNRLFSLLSFDMSTFGSGLNVVELSLQNENGIEQFQTELN